MRGDLLDLILIALAAAFAVDGYRQGFIVGVMGVLGFLGGAVAGVILSPHVAQALGPGTPGRALLAVITVFVAAVAGQLLASLAGAACRARLRWRPATVVDAVGGASVSVLSVLFIAWFIGSAVASAPLAGMARQVDYSVVIRGVNGLMPGPAQAMFTYLRGIMASGPLAQAFGPLSAGGALTVPPPDPRVLDAPGLARDRGSVVMVEGESVSCHALQGSGFVFAPQHVLTDAHVVAGLTGGPVVIAGRVPYRATVVYFDPRRDVAVLNVPGLPARPLRFARGASGGGGAIVAGYPQNSPFTAVPARVGGELQVRAPTIYQTGSGLREVYSFRASLRPGDSGAPLLAPDGAVYGMVFAAQAGVTGVGYALTAGEVQPDARAAAARTAAVSTQPWHCA